MTRRFRPELPTAAVLGVAALLGCASEAPPPRTSENAPRAASGLPIVEGYFSAQVTELSPIGSNPSVEYSFDLQ